MNRRSELLARLRSQSFDLLVIGGGIVGAGIARDAAMRGLRVALIERGDFAGGASSKTSKLIHGGLRYLEQGRLRLVAESLRERRILRTIAPQLVWPATLAIPVYRGDVRAPWKIACGLRLYDLLAGRGGLTRHRLLSPRRAVQYEPRLNPDGLRAMGTYVDCQMDDARLCLANILQAVAFGAVCVNYVTLLAFQKTAGRLTGAFVEDRPTGERFSLSARVVVNATGPWSDAVRRLSVPHAGTRLAPTKGIHVVVPRLCAHPLFVQARSTRRMMFLVPWAEATLLGTTESDAPDLETLSATPEEVESLLTEANRVVPGARLTARDVIATFAGARPLLAFSGSATRASREHRLEVDAAGVGSVWGGNDTTFRLMAKQTLDAVLSRWRFRAEACLTHQVGLLEPVHPVVLTRWQEVTRDIPEPLLARLLIRYGTGTFRILHLLEFEPRLIQPVCPHHDVIQAELVYALQDELACTVSDLLVRRTAIAFSACQGLDGLSTLTDLLKRYGRFSDEEIATQVHDYHQVLSASLACRGGEVASPGGHLAVVDD